MKGILSKIYAMIGMLVTVVSFVLLISAFVISATEAPVEHGVSRSFAIWVFSVITALFSLLFYFIDAILSIIKASMKIDPVFNAVLAAMLLGAIPMAVFVGGGLGINIYIWNTYYLAVFIMELV